MSETITDTMISNAVLDAEQRMEEELEKIYPSHGGSDREEPNDPDQKYIQKYSQKLVRQFESKFQDELKGEDARQMMFVMDVAIHTGETPRQLRKLVDQEGIEPLFQTRMSIHLVSKELGVSYWEAGKIVSDTVFGTED
jgi:hypothetical protein